MSCTETGICNCKSNNIFGIKCTEPCTYEYHLSSELKVTLIFSASYFREMVEIKSDQPLNSEEMSQCHPNLDI